MTLDFISFVLWNQSTLLYMVSTMIKLAEGVLTHWTSLLGEMVQVAQLISDTSLGHLGDGSSSTTYK